jgi:glyoxylate reductase
LSALLRISLAVGAGYDDVDVVEAKRRGIAVSHTPGAVDEATATTAIYLILGAMRQFAKAETSARQGQNRSQFRRDVQPLS